MESTFEESPMVSSTSADLENRQPDQLLQNAAFLDRLKQMPWPVIVAVTFDLVVNMAFHIITIVVLVDLHILNYAGIGSSILDASYFDHKAHFWTLLGCSLDLNLNTSSVLLWGLLVFAIGKGDPSWAKAWVMMKRIVLFLMLAHNAVIAFGGENSFVIFNCIFFFFYYLLSILTTEVISRSYIPSEDKNRAEPASLSS